jgi:GNAT superfamily N-acetyltransferase
VTHDAQIREPRPDELPYLQDIERDAGRWFRDIGMSEVADDEPPSIEDLTKYLQAGRVWVVTGPSEVPVAYLLIEPVDGNLHIEQVSVHSDHARRGLGRRLVEHAADHARAAHVEALTLTTFADVPWNAPYYERCGFRVLTQQELTPGLVAIRHKEAERGFDRWPRVCMRRDL